MSVSESRRPDGKAHDRRARSHAGRVLSSGGGTRPSAPPVRAATLPYHRRTAAPIGQARILGSDFRSTRQEGKFPRQPTRR
jgi:hypothetical protein